MILLKTQHGSHLYNLANASSDTDTFTVIADNPTVKGRYARQRIQEIDGEVLDETITDLSTFVLYASNSVPQYLEAMYAPVECVSEDLIYDMRMAFVPNYWKAEDTYARTIRNFYAEGEFKKRRHAYRLVLNLLDLRKYGRFNPRLNDNQLEILDDMIKKDLDPLEYLS